MKYHIDNPPVLKNLNVSIEPDIFSGGHNFNVSQRQLICLVRAILRNNRLFFLDEAMANIDSHTDDFQDTIRSSFKECTVITIVHRLNTIIDSNQIIVMGNSSIVVSFSVLIIKA
ncbi:Putative multidrug resistance-associated protein lethal(2)03659 [Acromyrmex echinatior]|uniref:Putative multidrug resistance-associated protein lethal(2)03659 n=1 Tax=Acromyrmex echinatior TaxID=103372 RepID=F4X5L4_ACREC|nr:Putative multidrug resistance-associated protein lethal(2)03659 [Acromyrmex echinatior]